MRKIYAFFLIILMAQNAFSQIVINELDCDTQGIDDKEFIELKTDQAFAALDDYVLVFFNGSAAGGNTSYMTIDLAGYTSDVNGIFLIGSSNVSPFPDLLIPPNVIQNGEDAVGLYYGDASDFPDWTLATTNNLVDALVYGTSDPVSQDLLQLLGQTEQIDENINSNKDFESIQRNPDGSYFVDTPTPGQNNDESGVSLNGIEVSIPQEQYNEGETLTITFNTDIPVDEDLNFNFTLNHNNFTNADFSGNTNVTIPQGASNATAQIQLLDDGINDGDKVMEFKFGTLPSDYRRINDYVQARVIDVNFETAEFGTPLNPTYDIVESTEPNGYYDSLDGLSGEDLRQAIQDIIANPQVVRVQTYKDVIDILEEADQNPDNSNQVWLLYTEQGRAKLDYQMTSSGTGKWNREHTFPRSRGGFVARDGDEFADGKNVYWTTSADSTRQAYSDAHALRAADAPENSSRNNKNYGPQEYNGPSGTAGSFYGDVARSVLFLTVRYNGLEIVDGYPPSSNIGQLGDLQTLLEWNQIDPPDDFEMNRNNIVYEWQKNRNPFIDYPELIEYLWGDHAGEVWHQPDMSVAAQKEDQIRLFPNPAKNNLFLKGIDTNSSLQIISMEGRILLTKTVEQDARLDVSDLESGVYFVHIQTQNRVVVKRFVIR